MRKALDKSLSEGLDRLRKDANDALVDSIFAAAFDEQLRVLQKMAINMEHELSILRQTEAGRELRTRIEQTATDTLANMLPSEGTVIRPDFGRKS
jgi:hypothetical protein